VQTLSPFARLMARSGRRTRSTRSILTTLIVSLLYHSGWKRSLFSFTTQQTTTRNRERRLPVGQRMPAGKTVTELHWL